MQLASYQTALKVLSILTIILAGFLLLTGALLFFSSGLVGFILGDPETINHVSTSMKMEVYDGSFSPQIVSFIALRRSFIMASLFIIDGLLTLIIGILGFRSSNNLQKIGLFKVFTLIGIVISVFPLIITITTVPDDISSWSSPLVSLVESGLGFWLTIRIQKQVAVYTPYDILPHGSQLKR